MTEDASPEPNPPAPPFDFRRMGSTAATIAQQLMEGAMEHGLPMDVMHDDLIGLAAHMLSMPLHFASEHGRLDETIKRWRELVRKIIAHEGLDPATLEILGKEGSREE